MSGIKSGDIVNWRTTNGRGNPCSRRAEVYFAPQGETVMLYVYGLKKLKRVPLSEVRLRRAEIARRKYTDSMTKKDIKKRQEARSREAHGYTPGLEINEAAARLHPHNCAVIERTANGVSVGACAHYLRNGTDCPRHGRVKAYVPSDGIRRDSNPPKETTL